MSRLPIEAALPSLIDAVRASGRAVLQAPPGAGKTTRVPLALLQSGLVDGRILMLEPRRLAARASAERMAQMLGEQVGETVGYRMRGDSKVGRNTRIEVLTEGILTRRLQGDPGLDGVGAVIFDEFHERSLPADLGLALTWEVRQALRDDLKMIVMSATLDATPVAELLENAPVITAEGRAFPVETVWLQQPVPRSTRFEAAVSDLVLLALEETEGGVLVFLPGASEIRRVAQIVTPRLPAGSTVFPLYGALKPAEQRAAILPARSTRKLVLATSIAETSLTIEDIRVVVDAGRARRSRFDPGTGMARLVTEPVSRAEAAQRRGRAGRIAPGTCYRLWTRAAEGALSAFPPPEIAAADLTGLALDLAHWGAAPEDLAFLTPPPEASMNAARRLLQMLGALAEDGRITDHGKHLARLPLHPRLGHMLAVAGPAAANLAALLSDRDPRPGTGVDLARQLDAIADRETPAHPSLGRVRAESSRLRRLATAAKGTFSTGEMVALAYPDRIGLRRPGDPPRWLLASGRGATMDAAETLAGTRLIAICDLDGDGRDAKIRKAAELSESALRALYGDRIESVRFCEWSKRDRRVVSREQERYGALVLSDRNWRDAPPEIVAAAALDGVRSLGLGALKPSRAFELLRARLMLARKERPDLPDPSDAALLDRCEEWLLPVLEGARTAADLAACDPGRALSDALDWNQKQALDRIAPPTYVTPLGRSVAIDYGGEEPEIQLRLQELFGETRHPNVAGAPLRVVLLSPAGRPVQVTMDLPGFWRGSYADVRKDMRARYPRHPWPEDPTEAMPTLRAKPRK